MIDGKVQELKPIFETEIERTVRALHIGDATIEAALDEGKIRGLSNDRQIPVNDLELEVKSGDAGSMFRVAVELALETPLMIEPSSKAERGYRLVTGTPAQAQKHSDVTLDKNAKTIDCFRLIIGDVIDHLWSNLAAAYAGHVDGVHQIRVGIRRLRTALLMFRKLLHRDTVEAYDQHLQHFGHVFGEARDWDVFVTSTLVEARDALPEASWLDLIQAAATSKQQAAHRDVRYELESRTFNSLILSMLAWTEDNSPMVASEGMDRPVAEVMPQLLTRFVKKVAQRQRRLNGSDERLHALRKSTKRLRYACEFSESLYPAKKVRRFVGPCRDIQQALGEVNDVATTVNLMAVLVAEKPALAPAVAKLASWLDRRKEEAERGIPKLLKRLHQDRVYWA
jgi:inorganic triphosphatase YgiF